ncbi:MAG: 16S rRNA (uracil(1498)-N(3))-methyltransferase [Bacteroidota bacterium]
MQLFFTTDIRDNLAFLGEDESRHIVQALRKQVGDPIDLVDGRGYFLKGQLVEAHKKHCTVEIQERIQQASRSYQLHVAIAPTKNIDRLEWFLEKATEIGIDRITPLLCMRSERKRIRHDRLERILISAMKQSVQALLPQLDELTDFKSFLTEDASGLKYIAHCDEGERPFLHQSYQAGQNLVILIGPEGDFHPEEIHLAKANGFKPLSLGATRLRTETAGLVACSQVAQLNVTK